MPNEGIFNSDWFERDYLTTFDLDKWVPIKSCDKIIPLPTDWLYYLCDLQEWMMRRGFFQLLWDDSDKADLQVHFVESVTPPCA